jgi:DnaJ-class molecular chaperone
MTEDSTGRKEDSTRKSEDPSIRAGRSQPRETCQMCQGTGRTAFVLPNLLHEEIPCPNCNAEKRQVRQINTERTKETYDR